MNYDDDVPDSDAESYDSPMPACDPDTGEVYAPIDASGPLRGVSALVQQHITSSVVAPRALKIWDDAAAPAEWDVLDDELAAARWRAFEDWVQWLIWRFEMNAKAIPDCWPRHPPVVEELTALWQAWDKSTLSGGDAPLNWLALLEQCRSRLQGTWAHDCANGHQSRAPRLWQPHGNRPPKRPRASVLPDSPDKADKADKDGYVQ